MMIYWWWPAFVEAVDMDAAAWAAWAQAITAMVAAIAAFGVYFVTRWHDARDLREGAEVVLGYAEALTAETLRQMGDSNAFLWRVSPEYLTQCRGALAYIDSIPLVALRPAVLGQKVIAARRAFVETIRIAERMHEDVITTPDDMDAAVQELQQIQHEIAVARKSLLSGQFIIREYTPATADAGDDEPEGRRDPR